MVAYVETGQILAVGVEGIVVEFDELLCATRLDSKREHSTAHRPSFLLHHILATSSKSRIEWLVNMLFLAPFYIFCVAKAVGKEAYCWPF